MNRYLSMALGLALCTVSYMADPRPANIYTFVSFMAVFFAGFISAIGARQ